MDLPLPHAAMDTGPFTVARPAVQTTPLIFASPHSGREYPASFLASARLDPLSLRRSEDSFVEELFGAAPDYGAPLLSATFPRAFCDANREQWELDPGMFEEALPPWVNTTSARVNAGLGTIARIVSSGEAIYRAKLPFAEAERRVQHFWTPYHAALAELIASTRTRFGGCLLVDCHSMPAQSGSQRNGPSADFVLGDAHGTTCSPRATRRIERALVEFGYTVRRNDPYAGGYITRHYGRPREQIHVLQIEVNRGLYMDEGRIERIWRFETLKAELTRLIEILATEADDLLHLSRHEA